MPRTVCKNEGCNGLIAHADIGIGSRCPGCKNAYLRRRARSQREAAMRTQCSGWRCQRTVRIQAYHEGPDEWTGRCPDCERAYRAEQESLRVMMDATERRAQAAETELAFYKRLLNRVESPSADGDTAVDVLKELLTHIVNRKSQ